MSSYVSCYNAFVTKTLMRIAIYCSLTDQLFEYIQVLTLITTNLLTLCLRSWLLLVCKCYRVVLLHGPAGTGKTSLCKALAHKLSIRLGHRYTTSQLLEINAHSLFSKVIRLWDQSHLAWPFNQMICLTIVLYVVMLAQCIDTRLLDLRYLCM
jgi:ATPase family associated with various cellular activities (AAA)